MAMRARAKKVDPQPVTRGKRYYFPAINGMHVSVRARNGLLAVKALPSWVLL